MYAVQRRAQCGPVNYTALAYAEGNYRGYEADLKRRKGVDAETPHRIKYKALVRR